MKIITRGNVGETFFTCEKFPQASSKTRLEHKDRGTLSHCPASPLKRA